MPPRAQRVVPADGWGREGAGDAAGRTAFEAPLRRPIARPRGREAPVFPSKDTWCYGPRPPPVTTRRCGSRLTSRCPLSGMRDQKLRPDGENTLWTGPPAPRSRKVSVPLPPRALPGSLKHPTGTDMDALRAWSRNRSIPSTGDGTACVSGVVRKSSIRWAFRSDKLPGLMWAVGLLRRTGS